MAGSITINEVPAPTAHFTIQFAGGNLWVVSSKDGKVLTAPMAREQAAATAASLERSMAGTPPTDQGASPNGPASGGNGLPAATPSGWSHTIDLGGGYRLHGTGAVSGDGGALSTNGFTNGNWYLTYRPDTGDTLNGQKVYGPTETITDSGAVQRIISALYAKTGYRENSVGGNRLWWGQRLTPEEMQAALANPAVNPTTQPTTVPAAPAPGITGDMASAPKRPGIVHTDYLASAAARDTVDEITREMAAKAVEQPVLATNDLKGYTPIKLRPRSR